MIPEQLARIEQRAIEVADGFKTAKDHHARDTLRLVSAVRSRDRQIAELQRQLEQAKRGNIAHTIFGGL